MYDSTFSRTVELVSTPRFVGMNSSDFIEEWKDSMTALSKQFPRCKASQRIEQLC